MPDSIPREPDLTPGEIDLAGLPVAPRPPTGSQPFRKRHGALRAGLVVLVLTGAGAGGWWWWPAHRAHPAAAPQPPMKVQAMTLAPRTVGIYRSFPALTAAMRSVAVQARVTGYLTQQGAVDGADVATGAMLYRIDDKDYRIALAQAEASLGLASASLDYSRIANGRNQALAHDGWVSRDTADQTQSTFHQGQATQTGNVAALREAALNLSRTEITAPFAGRISASQVFTGTLISVAGTTLNTLVQLDPIYVSFNPAEADLDAVTRTQAHAPVETAVSVGSAPPGHRGVVTFIDNQVSNTTGTILMRATIANPDHALLPGQYVTARLHLGDREGALLVPQNAVGAAQTGRFLMVAGTDGKAEQRIVKLGDSDGDDIVVTDGLKAGERVITTQLQKLKPGASVEIEAIPPLPAKP